MILLYLYFTMFEESLRKWIKRHMKDLPNDIQQERIAKSIIKRFLLSQNCSYYIRQIVDKLKKSQKATNYIVSKEEIYSYLKELIRKQYRQQKQQANRHVIQYNNIDLSKEIQDENTRPFPSDLKQPEKGREQTNNFNGISQNAKQNQKLPINNGVTWFGLSLFQNNSFCFYGHLLYGDKIWNILDYHYLENEAIEHQQVLIVWKQRKNGIIPLSTVMSISDLLYFRPTILSDTGINMSFQIRQKIEKIRILKPNKSS